MRFVPLALLLALGTARRAEAFIPAPVGGHAGELDLSLRLGLERGKVEPNESHDSFQRARWNTLSVGAGYTIGDLGPFRDVFVRLDSLGFTSPAERNDPARAEVDEDACLGRVAGPGRCEFHGDDEGALVTPAIGANLIHVPDFALGVWLQGSIPIGVERERFTRPRTDLVGGGVQVGVRLRPWLAFESRTFVGSGASHENAVVAVTTGFLFRAARWLLPWEAGVRLASYFEGDLTERFDARYDAAYTAGYPDRRDRIRSMKFGILIAPHVLVTDHLALELAFLQKLFGYDAPATQLFGVGVRVST